MISSKVIKSIDELETIHEFWGNLQDHPETDFDFFSFIIGIRSEIVCPYIISISKNDKLISLLVGRIEHGHLDFSVGYKTLYKAKVRRIVFFYGGLIGEKSQEVFTEAIQQLKKSIIEERVDYAVFAGINWEGDLKRTLFSIPSLLSRDFLARPTQHWYLNLPYSFEEFINSKLKKKHRYWVRRLAKQIEKDFPQKIRWKEFSQPEDVEQMFDSALQVARKTYHWGLGVGFRDSEENKQRMVLESVHGWFRGYVLYVSDQPVAFWICTLYKGTAYLNFTGYDPAFGRYEVGSNLLLKAFESFINLGIKTVDFGLGTAFYKERLGDHSTAEATIHIFSESAKGSLLNITRIILLYPVMLVRDLLAKTDMEKRIKKIWRSKAISTAAD